MIQLRDSIEDDFAIFFEHQCEPEAYRMAGFKPRTHKKFMIHWVKILNNPDIIKKTIVYHEQVAGNILCFEQDGKRLIGYWLGKEFWGQGIATRALNQLLRDLKIRPLYAWVAPHNTGSIRVLEKCGFTISDTDAPVHPENGDKSGDILYKLDK